MTGLFRTAVGVGVVVALLAAAVAAAAPGDLDPGFGDGGIVTTATAPGAGVDFQNGLAVQSNGRIVVGGSSDMGAAAGGGNWRVVRYKSNGQLDPSFGTGGVVLTNMSPVGGDDEHVWDVELQADGKVVAAGQARSATGGLDIALARFNSNGSLDTGFGSGGKVTLAVAPGSGRDNAFQVSIDNDGRVVIAGFADMGTGAGGRNFLLARYNSNGSHDASFGNGGTVITRVAPGDNRDQVDTNGLTIDDEDRLVVAGWADMGPGAGRGNFALARYDPDGSLDTSFDGDGIVTTAMAPGDNIDVVSGIAIDEDGKIAVSGVADSGGFVFDWALARYNPDGSLDASFDADGKLTANVGPGNTDDDLEDIVIQPTGRIVVGGSVSPTAIGVDSDLAVARYNPDGSLDSSFGSGGIVITNTADGNGADEIYEVALKGDSKVVVSGECDQATTGRDVCLARYKAGDGDDD